MVVKASNQRNLIQCVMANIIAEETLCFYTTQIFCCRNMLYGCPSVDKMFSVPLFNRSNRYRAFQRSNYIICRVLWTLIPFGSINMFLQVSMVNYLLILIWAYTKCLLFYNSSAICFTILTTSITLHNVIRELRVGFCKIVWNRFYTRYSIYIIMLC